MKNSKIEWCDHTFNPWEGCTKVSPGCANCYAENRNARFGGGTAPNWGKGAPRRRTSVQNWKQPLKWNAEAALQYNDWANHATLHGGHPRDAEPRRPRVFCASLADVFDPEVSRTIRGDLLNLIRLTPNLDWLLLTKRPELVMSLLHDCYVLFCDIREDLSDSDDWSQTHDWLEAWVNHDQPPANIWIGTTVENQEMADKRIPDLLKIPARVRFLSCEPLLGLVDLRLHERFISDMAIIDWVICGGESGPGARPMHQHWPRSLRDQCKAAGVPFLFKQWGEWAPWSRDMGNVEAFHQEHVMADGSKYFPGNYKSTLCTTIRIGKGRAGRLLDGVEYNEFPELKT